MVVASSVNVHIHFPLYSLQSSASLADSSIPTKAVTIAAIIACMIFIIKSIMQKTKKTIICKRDEMRWDRVRWDEVRWDEADEMSWGMIYLVPRSLLYVPRWSRWSLGFQILGASLWGRWVVVTSVNVCNLNLTFDEKCNNSYIYAITSYEISPNH